MSSVRNQRKASLHAGNASYCPIHRHQKERQDARCLESTYESHLVLREAHRSSSPSLKFVHQDLQLRKEYVVLRLHHRTSLQHRYLEQPHSSSFAIHWFHEASVSTAYRVQSPCRCYREEYHVDHGRHVFCRPLLGTDGYQAFSITPQKLMLNWNIAIPIVNKPPTM